MNEAGPTDDDDLAAAYEAFADKGPELGGYRLTVLVRRPGPGERTVRVHHVCEATSPDAPLYPMGPKEVLGEHVDGVLVTAPSPRSDEPIAPASYDGRVRPGPGIDANYDVTTYELEPGRHVVQWRLGDHVSNQAWVTVEA